MDILKTARFWLGFGLFFFSTSVAVAQLRLPWDGLLLKIGAVVFALMLYSLSQLIKAGQLSRDDARNQVQLRLNCVQTLRFLDPDQNLRSNLFIWNRNKEHYYIWQHYGMETDLATSVTEIPKGKGCTGTAWEQKEQVWGDKVEIFGNGKYALPGDQERKVRHELEWICSTPVVDKKRKVIAVVNFDGNKPMDASKKEFIKQHAARIAGELGQILSRTSLP